MYNKVVEILNKAVVKDIKIYDMRSVTPFYDYAVVASVNTARQGHAAVNYLKKEAENYGMTLRSFSKGNETSWFLVDLDECMVHVFVGEERIRYNIDGMYQESLILSIE